MSEMAIDELLVCSRSLFSPASLAATLHFRSLFLALEMVTGR